MMCYGNRTTLICYTICRLFPVVYSGAETEAEWLKVQMEAPNIASQIVESAEG
jgi:hypothetical protein